MGNIKWQGDVVCALVNDEVNRVVLVNYVPSMNEYNNYLVVSLNTNNDGVPVGSSVTHYGAESWRLVMRPESEFDAASDTDKLIAELKSASHGARQEIAPKLLAAAAEKIELLQQQLNGYKIPRAFS